LVLQGLDLQLKLVLVITGMACLLAPVVELFTQLVSLTQQGFLLVGVVIHTVHGFLPACPGGFQSLPFVRLLGFQFSQILANTTRPFP